MTTKIENKTENKNELKNAVTTAPKTTLDVVNAKQIANAQKLANSKNKFKFEKVTSCDDFKTLCKSVGIKFNRHKNQNRINVIMNGLSSCNVKPTLQKNIWFFSDFDNELLQKTEINKYYIHSHNSESCRLHKYEIPNDTKTTVQVLEILKQNEKNTTV